MSSGPELLYPQSHRKNVVIKTTLDRKSNAPRRGGSVGFENQVRDGSKAQPL